MKKFYTSVLISIFCFTFYFLIFSGINSNFSIINSTNQNSKAAVLTQTVQRNFINCIFNDAYEAWNNQTWILKFLDRYSDSLHFNSIHYYNYPPNSVYYGSFNSLMTYDQSKHNIDLLDSVRGKNLKTYTARQNVEKYCYGQRLVYEVSQSGSTTINDGFCYQNVMDSSYIMDQGRTVLHVIPNQHDSGWLCKSIYENLQHTDLYDFTQADAFDWHLKPMMRIDSSIFSTSNTTPVVAVVVKNYSDSTIDSIVVRVNNFRNNSNIYKGNYIELYNYNAPNPDSLKTSGSPTNGLGKGRDGDYRLWKNNCKVDFKVYWFGLVEVWFDKMTVDDEVANVLFTGFANPFIRQESDSLGSHPANLGFFADEIVYSNIPCVKYVDSVLKSANLDSKLHTAVSNYHNVRGFKNDNIGYSVYFQNVHLNSFNADAHEISAGGVKIPGNFASYDSRIPTDWIAGSYNEYNNNLQGRTFGDKNAITPEEIDLGQNVPAHWGSLIYQVELARQQRDLYSPGSQFLMQPQIHGVLFNRTSNSTFYGGLREPTNQEIQAEAMVSIAHGAEGICWFVYPSLRYPIYDSPPIFNQTGLQSTLSSDTIVNLFGLTNVFQDDAGLGPRYINQYGQDKWNAVRKMNIKLENWKPTLDKIQWQNGYSVHSEGAAHNFISDIQSIIVHPSPPIACVEDNINYDCSEARYWEMGFFDPDFENPSVDINDKSKYFMMVNRRCVPEINNDGDLRQLKIKFNSSQLSGFNNWKIIELDSNKTIATFDKNAGAFVNMGIYQPGEGKLYKIAPVMQEGGKLVANEVVTPGAFICKSDVANDGKNVTVNPNVNIDFAEGVKWDFQEGEIKFGNSGNSAIPSPVVFNSQSRSGWKGITLNQCYNVDIKYSVFDNIENASTALQIIDCREFNINHNTFNLNGLDSVIAIGVDYLVPSGLQAGGCGFNCEEDVIYINAVINNNTFNISSSKVPTLRLSAYSLYVVSLMADRNTFNSTSGSLAIFLSNVASGNIKNNSIYNYKTGINILSSASYADLYNNYISADSVGVQINNGTINLAPQASSYTGGFNRISAGSSSGNDIKTAAGFFYAESGLNTFNINNNSTAYHFVGTFNISGSGVESEYSAIENCFKLNGSESTPRENVNCISGLNCEVVFTFDPTLCAINQTDDYFVMDVLGDSSVFDTIWTNGEGGGGGAISNVQISMFNEVEIESSKDLYNSICIEMRKRNYEQVHTKCMELLNYYIDSAESLDALSKLYLADLVLDSGGNRLTDLKTFFETLILQNGGNENLVKKLFYLDQKCKAALGEYESAMDGFEQIINENPYSYEGLVASWDYAATSLLLQGNGGGEKNNYELRITNYELKDLDNKRKNNSRFTNDDSRFPTDDPNDRYDAKKFDKEDRKVIRENVFNSYKTSREKEIEIVKTLETKVSEGTASADEKKELQTKRMLSEIVKAKKPADITEHIKNVNDNIQKIFCSESKLSAESYSKNTFPSEYYLSQNYPNPFNPVTKIRFDLPHYSRVKLIVYDILGRELKTIVNSDLATGKYEYEFEGSNFASGVYFYRIEAVENSGKKFVQTKRMVLIK